MVHQLSQIFHVPIAFSVCAAVQRGEIGRSFAETSSKQQNGRTILRMDRGMQEPAAKQSEPEALIAEEKTRNNGQQ
jgi:hypothetical protein